MSLQIMLLPIQILLNYQKSVYLAETPNPPESFVSYSIGGLLRLHNTYNSHVVGGNFY